MGQKEKWGKREQTPVEYCLSVVLEKKDVIWMASKEYF